MSVDRIVTGWEYVDLLDRIMDKGIVLDGAGKVHLLGHELAHSNDHVVVRSTQTFRQYDKAA